MTITITREDRNITIIETPVTIREVIEVRASGIPGRTGPSGEDGVPGPQGEIGPQGEVGPNQVTTDTSTNITSLIKGDGAKILAAIPNTDYVPAVNTATSMSLVESGVTILSPSTKIGGATDNSEFEADGTLKFNGNATIFNDFNMSLVPPQGGSAVPAIIPVNGDARLDCYAFSGTNSTPDEIHSSLEIPHSYKEGSDIGFHIHWAPTTTALGDVKWQLRYMWFNRGEAVPLGTTASVVSPAGGVAWKEQFSNITIPGAGKTFGSRFLFCLFRDVNDVQDTYAANAATFDMGFHFESDTVGSRQITVK